MICLNILFYISSFQIQPKFCSFSQLVFEVQLLSLSLISNVSCKNNKKQKSKTQPHNNSISVALLLIFIYCLLLYRMFTNFQLTSSAASLRIQRLDPAMALVKFLFRQHEFCHASLYFSPPGYLEYSGFTGYRSKITVLNQFIGGA